jgi:polygalacturonase
MSISLRASIYVVALLFGAGMASTVGASVFDDNFPNAAMPVIPKATVDLSDFGGVGDGVTLNTEAFAKAIAALSAKGGGELVVPPGLWLTGPIRLCSNLELHVERGALVQFTRDYKSYPLIIIDMKGEKEVDSTSPISGQNLENIAITGDGVFDGGGDAWRPVKKAKLGDADWKAVTNSGGVLNEKGDTWWPGKEVMAGEKTAAGLRESRSLKLEDYEPAHQFLRPKMLRLIGCKKVLLEGVTFQNPPNWTMNPALCEDVSILRVEVRNSPVAQNSDALDLESCRRAVISGCTFDAGDDGICIKSGRDEAGRRIGVPTENVLVKDCVVYHAHGGFTIGSEMSGGVHNILVTNCLFIGTEVGLRFKSSRGRGGVVDNIFINNVRMSDIIGDAINFDLFYGGKSALDATDGSADATVLPVTEGTPSFRNIEIQNIICRGANRAIVLRGLPEMPLRGVSFKNVSITSREGVFATDADEVVFDNVRVDNRSGEPVKAVGVTNSKLDLVK